MAIFTAKTIDEAVEEGLKELGLTKDKAEIKILEEPTKGFLGINAKKAKVEITAIKSDGERAVEFLDELFNMINITAKCNLVEEEEKVVIDLVTDNSSFVIGYRGEVLDAIQCLAGAIANKGRDDYRRVVVDCEGYRQKREETLVSLANKLAAKAVRTGRKVILEPMNPYERRILHATLSDSEEVKTQSEGKEPNRYVAIIPNNLKPGSEAEEGFRRGNKSGGRRDNRGGKRREGSSYGERGASQRGGYRSGGRRERSDAPRQPRPKTSGFGTFLGNSLKDGGEKGEE